jgi:2-dehydropantoate 2-reductase
MRFVIYGAGAIGGTIGGRLFEAGHDVTLIARGAHAQVLQTRGLELASVAGSVTLPIPTVEDPGRAGLRPDDVVVLAMKGQDTPAALAALTTGLPAEVASGLVVVCAQNGVENERVVLRRLPRVYGMAVMCPATHLEPGRVLVHSSPISGLLDLGRYPVGPADDTARAIAAALRSATFEADALDDIMRWKYRKLILNLANAAIAVCGPVSGVGELIKVVQAEGEACLAAAGVEVATPAQDRERRGDLLDIQPVEGGQRPGGSSWQSLARGLGSIETDYLTGEVVLLGRLHGVPTPANELLQHMANEMAYERRAPGGATVDDILSRLDLSESGAGAS